MTQSISLPGRRPALSQPGSPVSATWVQNNGSRLVVLLPGTDLRKSEPGYLQAQNGELFVEPSIQTLPGDEVAVAYTNGEGSNARVHVVLLSVLASGKLRILSSFTTNKGEAEPDLALTASGSLLLATTKDEEGVALRSLQSQSLRGSRPLFIARDNARDPQLTSLSKNGLQGALLYRTDRSIRLALIEDTNARPKIRTDIQISDDSSSKGPAVSSDSDGLIAMSWAQLNREQPGYDVRLRSYTVGPNRLGPIRRAHDNAAGEQRDPMLAVQPDGLVRVVWRDNSGITESVATSINRITKSGGWKTIEENIISTAAIDPDVTSDNRSFPVFGWSSRGRDEVVTLSRSGKMKANQLNEERGERSGVASLEKANVIRASHGQDVLQGTKRNDLFKFLTRRHSLLEDYDVITGYNSNDRIDDHHARRNVKVDPITATSGLIRRLAPNQINRVCKPDKGFGTFGAVAFTVKGETGTWLAINDKRPGFQSDSDPIIYLKDFIPSIQDPIVIV
jgi:hypothetical protein